MTPTAIFRSFTSADLPHVLQFLGEANRLSDLCYPVHPGDFVHRLSNGLRGQNFEAHTFLYEDNGELVAVLLIEKKQPAFEVLIRHSERTPQLESDLMAWAEQTQEIRFRQADAALMADLMSGDELRQTMLMERGYQLAAQPYLHTTIRDLSVPIPPPALPDGFHIRSTTEADLEQLCAVHMSAFNSSWTPDDYLRT